MSSVLLFLGIILLVLFIITQASWWIFKKPWPSLNFCKNIHEKISGWISKVNENIKNFEPVEVFGLLATFLVICIVMLNITFLAQIFEVFLEPGKRISVPYVGTYGILTLVAGLIFGLIQIAFSITWDQKRKEKSRGGTILIGILIVGAIVVEAGLSYYRASMLMEGEALSPSFWDQVIANAI